MRLLVILAPAMAKHSPITMSCQPVAYITGATLIEHTLYASSSISVRYYTLPTISCSCDANPRWTGYFSACIILVTDLWPMPETTHSMAEPSALVSSYTVPRASSARKWAVAGAALIFCCVAVVMLHASTRPFVLRSKHQLVPDAGLNGPLNPTSASMRAIAPDVYSATVETTEGSFGIEVTRKWAPHAADRFYNLATNGKSAFLPQHFAVHDCVE